MAWEIVVGIETHAQLLTRSKMFSGASTEFGAAPNTQACAVDIALPGVLPVANKGAIELAIRFGLAVQGEISPRSVFARKNYFYPDLPKGYQISQYELPVVKGGSVSILSDKEAKTIRLTRAHLEEDAGKSLHDAIPDASGIDLNRAGTPLLEIVSEPELRGAKEAVAYARALHSLVRWIGICDGNMQEGSFRCDANVSVRRSGEPLGTRCEIKNLNSFRFMEKAIEFEARRQIELLEDGKTVTQETRLYDAQKDETRSMRSKEDAQDYRYFPDPDLLPLVISAELVEGTRKSMPELPQAKRDRYQRAYTLSSYDAAQVTVSLEVASYFEEMVRQGAPAKLAANWIMGELASTLHNAEMEIGESPVSAQMLAGLLKRVEDGTINNKTGKVVFDALWNREAKTADEAIEKQGLKQISDAGEIEKLVDAAIAAGQKQVEDYRAGKEKALQSLVGQVMKASKGKANPAQVNEILRRKLKS
ncbi:MAG TPA: Asp-tRNA(Asn)/Glu-tRNA(Gln) amidotransferase subunit GatB [Burkholderiales bacterium]|nr:Asp-tRNA(Asn)/Glu-tRNA(Gln) amidotransferase subunit GatB [Burkholderiales bacterium]